MTDGVFNGVAYCVVGCGLAAQGAVVWSFRRERCEPARVVRATGKKRVWKGAGLGLSAVMAAGLCGAAQAQEPAVVPEAAPANVTISTDRPSFSDGTGIQPVWRLNLETGYTFTFRRRDDVETQRHNGPEVLARVGLIEDRLEIRANWSGYAWSRSDGGGGGGFDASEGYNDLSLGLKVKLADQDGWFPRIALGASSTLGIGSDNVSNQIAEPTFKFIWSVDLGTAVGEKCKGFTLGGNANVAFPTTNGDRFTQGQGSVYLAWAPTPESSLFIEYFVVGPAVKGSDAAHSVDFGGTLLINPTTQLDGRVGFGLNEEADNAFVGVGISFLF